MSKWWPWGEIRRLREQVEGLEDDNDRLAHLVGARDKEIFRLRNGEEVWRLKAELWDKDREIGALVSAACYTDDAARVLAALHVAEDLPGRMFWVGKDGTLMRSDDEGETWREHNWGDTTPGVELWHE